MIDLSELSFGLVPIASSNQGCDTAIIFIHGFHSSSMKCWGISENKCWPAKLGEELGGDIFLFQYRNDAIGRKKRASLPFQEASESLATKISALPHQRIFFVTHSFGGIIVKQLIVHCAKSLNPSLQRICRRIYGLVDILCPNYGHWLSAALRFSLGFQVFESENLRILKKNSEELRNLHSSFLQDVGKYSNIQIHSIAELGYVFRFFRVKPTDAHAMGGAFSNSERNHLSICDNLESGDDEYIWIRDFIARRKLVKLHSSFGI